MSVQYSAAVRNAMVDAIESTISTSPKLRFYTGAAPANCAAAASGTLLVEMSLPSDWMSAASSGVKSQVGTWQANASAAGTAGHYRIVDTAGTTCHEQGTITATGGGGDMTLDNTNIASGQLVTITSKTITAGGA